MNRPSLFNSGAYALGLLLVGASVFTGCSRQLAGGTSTTDNPKVVGVIIGDDSRPAAKTRVVLLSENFNPVSDTSDIIADTTDDFGRYELPFVRQGAYNIQAMNLVKGTRLLVRGIDVYDQSDTLAADTLRAPGSIKIALPAAVDRENGYVYVPGTTVFARLKNSSNFVVLDSVAQEAAANVAYGTINTFAVTVLRYGVSITSNQTASVWNPGWDHCRAFTLNTTASGAGVAGAVINFPVLIRLNAGNFDFTQARNNGEDIRFTNHDNTFLSYEIERWDALGKRAEVWVKVDTVKGNDSTQAIIMYWGNSYAAGQSNGQAVFDTASGFQGVWHLGEAGNAIVKDATGNQYNGTPSDTAPAAADGTIGACRWFNGSSNYIRMNNTATSKLNFQENGIYTISAWAYADTLDIGYHMVAGKNNEQYFLGLKRSQPDTTMRWEFVEYHAKAGWQITQDFPSAKTWTHLVGVRKGNAQYLYVNGALVDSAIVVTPNTASRNTGDDVTIGRFLSLPVYTYEGKCPFLGKIDEVRILNVAPSADWIKLCYMNQKGNDALVKWQ